jgi:hypothetical protein
MSAFDVLARIQHYRISTMEWGAGSKQLSHTRTRSSLLLDFLPATLFRWSGGQDFEKQNS